MENKQIVEEFKAKTNMYDKDGGFIVYVEGYDNRDFDMELMEEWLIKALESQHLQTIELLDELAFEQVDKEKVTLFVNWDEAKEKLSKTNTNIAKDLIDSNIERHLTDEQMKHGISKDNIFSEDDFETVTKGA